MGAILQASHHSASTVTAPTSPLVRSYKDMIALPLHLLFICQRQLRDTTQASMSQQIMHKNMQKNALSQRVSFLCIYHAFLLKSR